MFHLLEDRRKAERGYEPHTASVHTVTWSISKTRYRTEFYASWGQTTAKSRPTPYSHLYASLNEPWPLRCEIVEKLPYSFINLHISGPGVTGSQWSYHHHYSSLFWSYYLKAFEKKFSMYSIQLDSWVPLGQLLLKVWIQCSRSSSSHNYLCLLYALTDIIYFQLGQSEYSEVPQKSLEEVPVE